MILVFNDDNKLEDAYRYSNKLCKDYGFDYKSFRNKKWVEGNYKEYKGYTLVKVDHDIYGGYKGIEITIKQ